MPAFRDLTGMKFGRLVVSKLDINRSTIKRKYWICNCECGVVKSVSGDDLKSGKILSCGCLKREKLSKSNRIEFDPNLGCYKGYFNTSDGYYLYDIDDKDIVERYCWRKDSDGYAITRDPSNGKIIKMHRLLMPDNHDKQIDHNNNNRTDNRKFNLRNCSNSENSRNKISSGTNTGERYITFTGGYYQFRIVLDKVIYKKCFSSLQDAIDYKNKFLAEHPDEFRYDYFQDTRNRTYIIYPFVFFDPDKIIKPFIFVEKEGEE